MILRLLEIDFIYNKTLMRNCPSETNSKEASWNLNSPMSKLWEIKKILEVTEWDSFWVKVVKRNLSQLIRNWEYQEFQRKIGIAERECDGMLWETALNYLTRYIVWFEESRDSIVWETVKYIWNLFKFWRSKSKEEDYQWIQETAGENNRKDTSWRERANVVSMFWMVPTKDIVSCPRVKSEETQSYCCSKTARLNAEKFWITLPRGDAYTAWITPTRGVIETLPKEKSWKKPSASWSALNEWEFDLVSRSANFADFYAESSTPYGHRAIAIRDLRGEWYVLDPYIKINGKTSMKPIKLGVYMKKWRKIIKAHFYHSNWYSLAA